VTPVLLLAALPGSAAQGNAEPAAVSPVVLPAERRPGPPAVRVDLHGDLKAFTLVSFPYEWPELAALGAWPTDPTGSATLVGRARIRVSFSPTARLDVHHAIAVLPSGSSSAANALGGTGVTVDTPELVQLTWHVPDDPAAGGALIVGRTDRLVFQAEMGPATLSIGRQPVFFGTGQMFTPLDLISPFSPATIDSEYAPGVDAARLDVFAGLAVQQSLAVAWAGACTVATTDPDDRCDEAVLADLVLASWTRATVGVSDLALFLGEVHDDEVIGASVVSAAGPVGLHGDVSLTLPPGHLDDAEPTEDPFVRAVVGADVRLGATTSLTGELYVQTNGATDSDDYLLRALEPRYARGELWALGRLYAGLAVAQEFTPTVSGALAVLANLEDPSFLLAPTLAVNVSAETALSAGMYVGVGERPEGFVARSEMGLLPATAFVRLAVYR
jgi:hypothetical protein